MKNRKKKHLKKGIFRSLNKKKTKKITSDTNLKYT